jgi:hypothetical protein
MSFKNTESFRKYACQSPILYFHIFRKTPNESLLSVLQPSEMERVILLDVEEDLGFLTGEHVTIDVTSDHKFVSKPLSQTSGLGAWAKGVLVDYVDAACLIPDLIKKSRRFAFPPTRAEDNGGKDEQN